MSLSQLLNNFLNFREFEPQLLINSILIRKNECNQLLVSDNHKCHALCHYSRFPNKRAGHAYFSGLIFPTARSYQDLHVYFFLTKIPPRTLIRACTIINPIMIIPPCTMMGLHTALPARWLICRELNLPALFSRFFFQILLGKCTVRRKSICSGRTHFCFTYDDCVWNRQVSWHFKWFY